MTEVQTLIYDIAYAITGRESTSFVVDSVFKQWAVRKIENAWIAFRERYTKLQVMRNANKNTVIVYEKGTMRMTREILPNGRERLWKGDLFFEKGSRSEMHVEGLDIIISRNVFGQTLEEQVYDWNEGSYHYFYNKNGEVWKEIVYEDREEHFMVDPYPWLYDEHEHDKCTVQTTYYYNNGNVRKTEVEDFICYGCQQCRCHDF